VAEVDCTRNAAIEKWCSKDLKVVGFPTLYYGDPSSGGSFLLEYNGDKDYEALSKFANETLAKPFCSPGNLDACDDETRRRLEEYWTMSVSSLEDEISRREAVIDDAERNFKREFDRMQAEYDARSRDHVAQTVEIKSTLKILNAVKQQHGLK